MLSEQERYEKLRFISSIEAVVGDVQEMPESYKELIEATRAELAADDEKKEARAATRQAKRAAHGGQWAE